MPKEFDDFFIASAGAECGRRTGPMSGVPGRRVD
jgi:hypothetical protein